MGTLTGRVSATITIRWPGLLALAATRSRVLFLTLFLFTLSLLRRNLGSLLEFV
jgi:hypothetical protein